MSDDEVSRTAEDKAAVRPRVSRARAVPYAGPFRVATFFWGLHCLGLVAAVTGLAAVFLHPSDLAPRVMAGALGFSGFLWLIAYFKRRGAKCPLCKGTPLLNSGAVPHARAQRLGPMTEGVSAMISIMATQRFRCMYCGSDYDLLKPRTPRTSEISPSAVDETRRPHA